MSDRLLKVSEVADILRVSQMTVIRKCRDGVIPFIRVGSMRRIKEVDLDYYILNPNKKPKTPEPERPVYVGPPADQNGFEDNKDERDKEMEELCANAKPIIAAINAKNAREVKAPAPPLRITDKPGTGMFLSGFDKLL